MGVGGLISRTDQPKEVHEAVQSCPPLPWPENEARGTMHMRTSMDSRINVLAIVRGLTS